MANTTQQLEEDEVPTLDQVVLQYRKLREKAEDILNEAKEKAKIYTDAMEQIENLLSALMTEMKLNSLPTDHGTAYKTTVTNVKITDRTKFMKWAYDNHPDLLQVSCNKTALKEYEPDVKQKKAAKPYPPGIEVAKLQRVNIRGK
jgi:uncharacterized protein (DUF342 family)